MFKSCFVFEIVWCEVLQSCELSSPLQYTSEHHQFSSGSQQWESLKQAASSEHTVAENTRKFWETCPNKFAVSRPVLMEE